jgi:hypothetical protein
MSPYIIRPENPKQNNLVNFGKKNSINNSFKTQSKSNTNCNSEKLTALIQA